MREELRVELVLLRRHLAIPMLYVTHDRAEALAMGDRIAVLADGVILQCDQPEAVWNKPASAVVAGLIGHPSFVR